MTTIDSVLPFQVDALDVRGRVVHLGPALDTLLRRHGYPEAVARLLGEATALTALLGTSMKFEGRFTLQTQSDGAVSRLVVDFTAPDKIRACATFDAEAVAAKVTAGEAKPEQLLGEGVLAMTVDMGQSGQRYQGYVPLDGRSLEDAAHSYFEQSEQIPTRVRLAVGEMLTRDGENEPAKVWRAGGIMVQFLPSNSERIRLRDAHPGDAPEGALSAPVDDDDAWSEAQSLVSTVEDHELIDPEVSAETLLYRLFNQRDPRVFDRQPIIEKCRCTRDAVHHMLKTFNQDDRDHMVKDGKISVTCEFCSTEYVFVPGEIGAAE